MLENTPSRRTNPWNNAAARCSMIGTMIVPQTLQVFGDGHSVTPPRTDMGTRLVTLRARYASMSGAHISQHDHAE
jgi:hypothetical protein